MFDAEFRDARRGRVRTEINHHVALGDDRREIVALINLADDFEFGMLRCAGDEGFAHTSARSGDDDSCHVG